MKTKFDRDKTKKAVEKTAKITVKMVKIIFLIIIFYTVSVTISVFLFSPNREEFLYNIATISAGGFWAFFLGYFGWRLGQSIELYLIEIKKNK